MRANRGPVKRLSHSPDTPAAAALRFALEVGAWLAILQAWGWWALVLAVLALALFNARGDKKVQGILVPGPLRVVLEIGVFLLGSLAAAQWIGPLAGLLMAMAVLLLIVVGRERYRWLLRT
jgi:asparagine N-glycosylation enzyme membrane subunit Stt3